MNLDLRFYWALFLRRLPVMMILLLVSAGLGVVSALKLPDVYTTSARLLVEAPQIPDNMVAPTVQTDASEQLEIIQQKLLTRANLIDVAHRAKVFENIERMPPDKVVAAMLRATEVRRSSGRDRATLMSIGFQSASPQTAANVVNEYVTLVLEENAAFRTSRAGNTLQFFEQEVKKLGEELNRQGGAIANFKSENADALPEDRSYLLNRQNLFQERLAGLERDLKATTARREEIVRTFEATGSVGRAPASSGRLSPEEEQLRKVQLELENAKAVYAPDSPRVVRLQAVVDRLRVVVAGQDATAGEDGASPEKVLFDTMLVEIDSRINSLQTDIATTQAELEALQQTISKSAANGITLANLERDYNIVQNRYNAAVTNLNRAQMSERVETTAQGQRITVIENANVPREPSGPDRAKIALMGALVGMGLAGAYFLLLEFLNRTIRRPSELIAQFNVTPITTIPYMETQRERLLRRAGLLATTLAVLVSVPLALWYIDTRYMPLEVIVQMGLATLGLG